MAKDEKGPIKKTWIIEFNKDATLDDIVVVLNNLCLTVHTQEMVDKLQAMRGIDLREGGVVG